MRVLLSPLLGIFHTSQYIYGAPVGVTQKKGTSRYSFLFLSVLLWCSLQLQRTKDSATLPSIAPTTSSLSAVFCEVGRIMQGQRALSQPFQKESGRHVQCLLSLFGNSRTHVAHNTSCVRPFRNQERPKATESPHI